MVTNGERADHNTASPGPQERLDIGTAANTAACLHLETRSGDDIGDQACLAVRRVLGPVEIDKMKPGGPSLGLGARDGYRIGAISRLLLEIALVKPDNLACDQINGRIDDHVTSAFPASRQCQKIAKDACPDRA